MITVTIMYYYRKTNLFMQMDASRS